jgi:hypothetical protein
MKRITRHMTGADGEDLPVYRAEDEGRQFKVSPGSSRLVSDEHAEVIENDYPDDFDVSDVEIEDGAEDKANDLGVDLHSVEPTKSGKITVSGVEKAEKDTRKQEREYARQYADDRLEERREEIEALVEELAGIEDPDEVLARLDSLPDRDVADMFRLTARESIEEDREDEDDGEGPNASDAAVKTAKELDVDLDSIEKGSGKDGAITVADVRKASDAEKAKNAAPPEIEFATDEATEAAGNLTADAFRDVKPSGKDGTFTVKDVEKAHKAAEKASSN